MSQRIDEKPGQAVTGPFEEPCGSLEAGPGASRESKSAEGKLHGDAFALCLRGTAEKPKAEPSAISDHHV